MNQQSPLSRRRAVLLFGLFLTAAFTVNTSGTGAERWTQSAPSNPPSARFNPTFVSDTVNDRAIVFGGGANCAPLNDVWLLTNASGLAGAPAWSQLTPSGTGPDARYDANAVYDAATNRMIVFGGAAGGYCVGAPPPRNDVWVLTNANGLGGTPAWLPVSPSGTPPAPRASSTSVYDPSTNRLIVFGGNRNVGYCFFESNETWILTFANGVGGAPQWINANPSGAPPIARFEHSAVYDASANEMIIFGGQDSCGGHGYADAWALVNANGVTGIPTWVSLGSAPLAQGGHTSVLDAANHRMLTYGGGSSNVTAMSNTNTTTGQLWTTLTPTGTPPSPRYGHGAVFDNLRQSMIVFGGANGPTMLNDTWVFGLGPAATALTMSAATGTFGGTATLQATLSSAAGPIAGMSVDFSVLGVSVGSATTGSNGVATLSTVSLSGRNAGVYGVGASFAATANYLTASAMADLTISQAPISIAVLGGGTFPYDGSAHAASGLVTGVLGANLGPASITYSDQSNGSISPAAPANAGSYRVNASFAGNANYLEGSNSSITITISQASTTTTLQTWSSVTPAGTGPVFSTYGSAEVSDAAGRLIVVTADTSNPFVLSSAGGAGTPTWSTYPAPGHPVQKNAAAAYDPNTNTLMLYGGCGGGCFPIVNQVWVLKNANGVGGTPAWSLLPTAGGPPAQRQAMARGYDPATHRLMIFGGQDGGGSGGATNPDVWVLTNADGSAPGSAWARLLPDNAPAPGQWGPSSWYDPASNRLIVAGGGAQGSGTLTNAVWALTNANGLGGTPHWVNLIPEGAAGSPSGFVLRPAAYDPATNRAMIVEYGTANLWVITNANGLGGAAAYNRVTLAAAPTTLTDNIDAPYDPANHRLSILSSAGQLFVLGSADSTGSVNPSIYGQPVTFTATVTPIAPATGTRTGTVTFKDGATAVGTAAVNAAGQAVFTTTSLSASGTPHAITAVYGGDTNFTTSTSAPQSHTVTGTSTTTTLSSSPNPSTFAQSVTFTATVTGSGGTPSGTVDFKEGGTTLATGAISGGVATLVTSSLSLGSHSITAVYGGDTTFITSTSSAVSHTVNPAPAPTASFTANPNPAACHQSVMFDGSGSSASSGLNIAIYAWNFGDGATGAGSTTTHVYNVFGTYSATLTVTDNNAPAKTGTSTVVVNVNQGNRAPVANHGGPYLVDLGGSVTLNGAGSNDADTSCGDSIASYAWSINGGAITLTGASPSLSAAQVNALGAGTFAVSLTVADTLGVTGTTSTTLSIYNNVATASFTATPNPAACSQTITFNASSSTAGRPDRAIVSYAWNFGDGATGAGSTTTHAYSTFGSYSATLTVTDDNVPPKTGSKTTVVNVNLGNQAPTANAGGPYVANSGSGSALNGSASSDPNTNCGDSIATYSWTIDAGAVTVTGNTPSLSAAQISSLGVGIHNVSLTVADSFGATSTATTTLTVQRVLVSIAVTPASPSMAPGQTQQFTATGTYSDASTQLLSGTGSWTASGSMVTARTYHTATLLQDGSVLVAGGYNGSTTFASAERYYPGTGTWVSAGSMASPRNSHSATLLPNGKVLVAGGIRYPNNTLYNTTELYDPATNSWTAGAPLTLGIRASHSAVLLGDGKVLVVAGLQSYPDCTYRSTAELYTPATNTWAATGSLHLARSSASTTLLANGKVLLAAGPANNCPTPNNGMNQAEIYDPVSGAWTVTGNLSISRWANVIATLPNGKALLAGGISTGSAATITADLYDPSAGTFALTGSLAVARVSSVGSGDNGSSPVLQSGKVLFAGGSGNGGLLATAELYDPTSGTWSNTGSLNTARAYNTATLLQDGRVLVVGGSGTGSFSLASAELYTPTATVSWASSNGSVAAIAQSGLAMGVSSGTSTITATFSGVSGDTTLTVTDNTSPTTTATPSPSANAAGWNNTNVTVTLNATDTTGGSGVQSIVYSYNGNQNGGPFTVAGNSASVSIAVDGTTTVTYHAIDNSGNVEGDHAISINIDKVAPSLSYPSQVQTQATSSAGASATFSVSASDSLSGLLGSISVTPKVSGDTFPVGTTTEHVTATDKAGNTANALFDVLVKPNRPNIVVTGGTFSADGNPHPATATATDSFGTTVPGTFSFAYVPGGSAPVAAGRYSAAASFTSASPAFSNSSAWMTMAPDPHAKSAPSAVEINGKLYVHGFDQNPNGGQSSFVSRLSIYDSFSNTWTIGASPSVIRGYGMAAAIGGKLYVVGGCVMSDCANSTNVLEIYDPALNAWSIGTPMPTSRFGAASGVIGGKLYVTGGSFPWYTPTNVTEIYDPVSNTWTTGPAIPASRELPMSAVFNGELYVIGGYQRNIAAAVGRVDVFNPTTGWSTRSAKPTASWGGVAGVVNGQVYVVGGLAGTGGFSAANESYDPFNDNWTSQIPMPTARTYVSGAVVNGRLYAIDGYASAGFSTAIFSTNEAFDPSLTARITINAAPAPPTLTVSPTTAAKGTGSNFTFSGTGVPGATLILDGSSPFQGSMPIDGTGHWSVFFSVDSFLVGSHTMSAKQSSGGLTSAGSTAVSIHVRPPVPGINSPSSVMSATSPASVTLSGFGFYGGGQTPPTGSTVTIFEAQNSLGTAVVASNGQWSTTVSLTYGSHTLRASQTLAGETSDLAASFSITVSPTLASVSVSPSTASTNVGNGAFYQATGHYSDGSTQALAAGSSPNPGGGGNGGLLWDVSFAGVTASGGMALDVNACSATNVPGGFSSEVLMTDATTGAVLNGVWEPGNPIVQVVGGQISATEVSATLRCATSQATASFSGTWNGTQYVGTYTDFAGHSDAVTVSPRSLIAMQRSDTQLSLGWGANGHTSFTVDYLGPQYFGGAQPSCGEFPQHGNIFETTNGPATIGGLQPFTWYHIHVHPLDTGDTQSGEAPVNIIIVRTRAAGSSAFERLWAGSTDYVICGGGDGGGPSSQAAVEWESSDTSVAIIDSNGNATGIAPGQVTITASVGDVSCADSGSCGVLTVTNDAPNVQIYNGGPSLFNVGATFSADGSFFDSSTNPADYSGMVDYGDGTVSQLNIVGGSAGFGPSGTFSLNHAYASAGTFTITVSVTDRFNATGTATRTVTVNDAPMVTLNAPFGPGDEGSQINASGSFTDAAGDGNWAVIVDYGDNTGQNQFQIGSFNFSLGHTYKDNGVYTLTVSVRDKYFAQSLPVSTQVTINNVAPAISLQATFGPILESPFNNLNSVGGTFSDPGSNDGQGPGFRGTVNYGDDTGDQFLSLNSNNGGGNGPATGNFGLNHNYTESGSFTITVTVKDKDDAIATATMVVTVNNVAPSLSGGGLGSGSLTEGGTYSRTGLSFGDPGRNDAWTATVDYGDGTGAQPLALYSISLTNGFPRGKFDLSHRYVDNGVFTVTVVVTDKDGESTTTNNTAVVTVNNQAPDLNVDFSNSSNLEYAVPFTASGTFSDAGANDAPWTGTINFGDGTGNQPLTLQPGNIPPGAQPLTRGTFTAPSHTYGHSGEYTWTLSITDKDGASPNPPRTITRKVEAQLVSIVVTPSPAYSNAIGATKQFSFLATFNDGSTFTPADLEPGDTDPPVFESTNPSVATINSLTGLATAVGSGVTTIVFRDSSGTGTCVTTASCATLTVDLAAPVINAADVTVEAASGGGAPATFAPTATDNLDPNPSVSADHASGATYPIGTTDVVVTATDVAGNSSTKTIHINVVDTHPPTLNLVGANPLAIEAGSTFTDPGALAADTVAGDLTSAIRVTGVVNTGAVGAYVLTYSVSDGYNTTTRTRTVNVGDSTAPTVTAPADMTAEASGPNGAFVNPGQPVASDAAGPVTITRTPAGNQFTLGATTITWTATDAAGNSRTAMQQVTIVDTTEPSVTVPANVIVEGTSPSGGVVTFSASATDLVDGSTGVTCTPASGSTFVFGPTAVNCSSNDSRGNTGTRAFTVTVRDTVAPIVTVLTPSPNDFVATAPATVTVDVQVADAGGAAAVTINGVSAANVGTTAQGTTWRASVTGPAAGAALTITASATDRGGLQGITSAVYDNDGIEGAIDRGRTTLADQSSVFSSEFSDGTTAGVIQRLAGARVTAAPVGGAIRVTLVNAGAAQIQACINNVKYVVLDAVGESADISCGATGTITATGRGPGTIDLYKQTPESIATGLLRCQSFSMFLPLGVRRAMAAQCSTSPTPVSYYYAYHVLLSDGQTASTGSPMTASPDNTEPIHVRLLQIEQDGGNQVEVGSFDLDPGESVDVSITPGANQYNDRQDVITVSVLHGSVTVTIGNIAQTVSQGEQVTVDADLTQPTVAIASPSALTTSDSPIVVSVVFSEPVGGFDATKLAVTNATVFGFAGSGAVYTFGLIPNAPGAVTAAISGALFTDLAGNVNVPSAVFTRTFTWSPPVVTTSGDVTVEATSPNGAVAAFDSSSVDAGGGSTSVTCVPQSGSTFPMGTTTVTCSSTDRYNNTGSGSFSVKVVDTTKPALTLPANITVDATSAAGAVVTFSASATDIVSGAVTVNCSRPSGSMLPISTTTVTCSAADAAGNSVSGSFNVLVQAAAAQVTALIATVQSFNLAQGIENSLDTKLQNVVTALNAAKDGNASGVCGQMGAFINETTAQSGKKLSVAQANQLIAAAQQIKAVLGCP